MALFKITRESGIPLVGCLYFGIIDRSTNLLQVRAYSGCNLNCPFCSVDAGPNTKSRVTVYEVELDYLIDWIKRVIGFKNRDDIEIHLDSVGEPMMYPHLVELVRELRRIPQVNVISMQTNGTLLDAEKIKALEHAGLDRINLSMEALDSELAKKLSGCIWYDIEKVKEAARLIAKSKIDLLIAPVYLHGLNDAEMPKLIAFAKEVGAGKKWPALGIQKFLKYKMGRTPRGIKIQNWWQFYNKSIKAWEKESGTKLIITPKDFGIVGCDALPLVMEKGEKINCQIVGSGWITNEVLGVANDRIISILECNKESGMQRVRIVSNKHGIYIGEAI